jgi:hypothetical protein
MPAVYAPSAPPGPHIPLVPAISLTLTTKVLKLDAIKDAKAFLDSLDIIKFYLCKPKFSSGLPDGALVTTPSNLKASCLWEGRLQLAVKDEDVHFLFKNKGTLFNGRGFEMLAALTCSVLHEQQDNQGQVVHRKKSVPGSHLSSEPMKISWFR